VLQLLQAGAGAAQVLQAGLQHLTFTHFTLQQFVSQQLLWQPQPLEPSIRSSSSKPKLWLQVAKPRTIVLRIMFHFIERRLLNDGTFNLAQLPNRPTRGIGRPR
jgi:hypothetical protein